VLEYRAYTIGADGHFTGSLEMLCRNDGEAVVKAKNLVDGRDRFGTATVLSSTLFRSPNELPETIIFVHLVFGYLLDPPRSGLAEIIVAIYPIQWAWLAAMRFITS